MLDAREKYELAFRIARMVDSGRMDRRTGDELGKSVDFLLFIRAEYHVFTRHTQSRWITGNDFKFAMGVMSHKNKVARQSWIIAMEGLSNG